MLTLRSNKYKKEDLVAFATVLETDLLHFLSCEGKGTNSCKVCSYHRCCYDLNKLYFHILEKIKSSES